MRNIPSLLGAAALALASWQSVHAQTCFFSEDFEGGSIPAGWTNSVVTVVDTGGTVDAWTVGTAAQANVNTGFPVLDQPVGNLFAMANDDAPPCDCTMDQVYLTTPVIDLSARTNVALECRVFHEMALGSGPAKIEVTINGTDWILLDSLDAVEGEWQQIFIGLGDFDGEASFQLRFNWSDGGNWASGFAVDDVCLLERFNMDMAVLEVRYGNSATSPFTLGDQTLRYTQLPLAQAGPIIVSVEMMNSGTVPGQVSIVNVDLLLDGVSQGSFSTGGLSALSPGERDTAVIETNWVPTAVGQLEAIAHIDLVDIDEDTSDNMGTTELQITGPGWEDGYGAMACDDRVMQGTVGGSSNFIAANRMEIINEGSTARGVSAVIAGNSQVGETVRAILMDGNFSFIDTSLSHVLTEADLNSGWSGEALYLPFSTTPALEPGDYHVGLQRLTGTGDVFVATSGTSPPGAGVLMQGPTFDITYLTGTPMVRLHLEDYGVGLAEWGSASPGMSLFPVPADDMVSLSFELDGAAPVYIEVIDLMGRTVLSLDRGTLPAGTHTERLEVSALAAGGYSVQLKTPAGSSARRLVITH